MVITLSIILSLILAVNLAVAWFWLVKRISDKGYGEAARRERRVAMMPRTDQTLVVEQHPDGRDTVRTVRAEGGVSATVS